MTPDEQRLIEKVEDAGDFITGDDGFVLFWPTESRGAFYSRHLRIIADELDRRNAAWEAKIAEYFGNPENLPENPNF